MRLWRILLIYKDTFRFTQVAITFSQGKEIIFHLKLVVQNVPSISWNHFRYKSNNCQNPRKSYFHWTENL